LWQADAGNNRENENFAEIGEKRLDKWLRIG
jgi:hypothetical protein